MGEYPSEPPRDVFIVWYMPRFAKVFVHGYPLRGKTLGVPYENFTIGFGC